MMERQIIKFMLVGIVVVLSACYYDSAENLYPTIQCVTVNMSLQTDIMPILQRNCITCHSAAVNSGNVTLDVYSELMIQVNNGKLLGSIKHDSGLIPMPQNAPKLTDCDIARIGQWIIDGAANN